MVWGWNLFLWKNPQEIWEFSLVYAITWVIMISKLFCVKAADMNSLYKFWYHRMEKIAISIFVKILNQIGRDGPYAGPPFTIMSGSTALQSRGKKLFQNRSAFYFHRQSDENRIMWTVKEIRCDFNWSINLVNILMYSDKISFYHFIYFLLSPLFRFGFYNISKEYPKKTIIFDKYSAELMYDADIYLS